jgi:hypothetical protein
MAPEHMCVSMGDPSTYTLICIATAAHAHIGGATAHIGRACVDDRPSAVRRGARAGPKAAHTASIVVTEAVFHAPMFALKADARKNACEPINATLGGGGRCSHALARMRARPRTHTSARAHACTLASARTRRMSASAIRACNDRRTGQGVGMECISIPIHPCVSPWLGEESALAHTQRSAVPSARAHGHVGMHGRGTDTHPRACMAQESYL